MLWSEKWSFIVICRQLSFEVCFRSFLAAIEHENIKNKNNHNFNNCDPSREKGGLWKFHDDGYFTTDNREIPLKQRELGVKIYHTTVN